jgi:hypothetical protein
MRLVVEQYARGDIDERHFLDRIKELTKGSRSNDPDTGADTLPPTVGARRRSTEGLRGAAVANRIRKL